MTRQLTWTQRWVSSFGPGIPTFFPSVPWCLTEITPRCIHRKTGGRTPTVNSRGRWLAAYEKVKSPLNRSRMWVPGWESRLSWSDSSAEVLVTRILFLFFPSLRNCLQREKLQRKAFAPLVLPVKGNWLASTTFLWTVVVFRKMSQFENPASDVNLFPTWNCIFNVVYFEEEEKNEWCKMCHYCKLTCFFICCWTVSTLYQGSYAI